MGDAPMNKPHWREQCFLRAEHEGDWGLMVVVVVVVEYYYTHL